MNGPIDTALLDDLLRTTTADGIRKHVVGAVIAGGDGRVLPLHRTADDYLGGLWELPSGGVDEREALGASPSPNTTITCGPTASSRRRPAVRSAMSWPPGGTGPLPDRPPVRR